MIKSSLTPEFAYSRSPFADNGYDSYSESCDVEDKSVESKVDDPEEEDEETKFDNCRKVGFVATNDKVMRLKKEIERISEENRAGKGQIRKKDTICDKVMKLRGGIERLREENRAQKDQLKQKDSICHEAVILRKEMERLREENKT